MDKSTREIIRNLVDIQLDRIGINSLIIVEIGSFDGIHAIHWAKKYPLSEVHAIEPCPDNFKVLCENARNFKNVKPSQVVISNKNKQTNFFIVQNSKYEGSCSSKANSLFEHFVESKRWGKNSVKKIRIPSFTLDYFCYTRKIDRIDLLEMNCEGGEYQILLEGSRVSLERTNVVDIVLHGKDSVFLSLEYVEKKLLINKMLIDLDFEVIYGYNLNDLNDFPVGHVRQIWIKKDFVF